MILSKKIEHNLGPYIQTGTALLMVECFVISRIRMFSEITGVANKKDLDVIQKIINNAIRVVYNLRKFDHISSFANRVPWGDIRNLSNIAFKAVVDKTLQGCSSVYLQSLLKKSSSYRFRRQRFVNERSKTNIGQKRFQHRASTSLNRP